MKKTQLTIKSHRNPSGTQSWRVEGWFLGERLRKNFRDRADALAEKSILEIRAAQTEAGMRSAGTFLNDAQLREAEAAFMRLNNHEHSLSFCVEYALEHYRAPTRQKRLSDAIREYRDARQQDHAKNLISDAQFKNIRKQLHRLDLYFPNKLVSDLDAEKLSAFCSRGNAKPKTHNNRRGLASTLLKFAENQGWIVENPIAKVPHYRIAHKRGTASTLSAEQAEALMHYLEGYREGVLVTFYAVCLFAGIRPDIVDGEIAKLPADDVDLETGVIRIEPDVSKVGMKRNVAIQPNLVVWLKAYPLEKYPLIVPGLMGLRTLVGKKFGLTPDILRHTYISMHVAKFRSMGDTALQAGNSEAVIRKYYLDVKSPEEAERFFAIFPEKGRMEPVREDILRFPSREWTTNVASRCVQRK